MSAIKGLTICVDDLWDAKNDVERFISKYHKDSLIGDKKVSRRKRLRIEEAVQLIQNMESTEHKNSVTNEEIIRSWVYWFACVDCIYWFDIDEVRKDLNIKKLVEKYSK